MMGTYDIYSTIPKADLRSIHLASCQAGVLCLLTIRHSVIGVTVDHEDNGAVLGGAVTVIVVVGRCRPETCILYLVRYKDQT